MHSLQIGVSLPLSTPLFAAITHIHTNDSRSLSVSSFTLKPVNSPHLLITCAGKDMLASALLDTLALYLSPTALLQTSPCTHILVTKTEKQVLPAKYLSVRIMIYLKYK